ncbi:MAG TPA: outer membrane protein assembly factor BamD, partial [Polyangiaceae bacterium]|nr:outer membrane protein assembly factor BamD [Polyangiaceae bacterium]
PMASSSQPAPTAPIAQPQAQEDAPDNLADEAALVRSARRDLREGHARAARDRLEKAKDLFPDGTLDEERKVLYVEALVKTGSLQRAKLEAGNFLRAHPTSPHAPRLRALVGR